MENNFTLNISVTTEIRAGIARLNISHLEFAIRCGWTSGYLSRRMTGQVAWSTDELQIVAGQLGISAQQLIRPELAAS